LCGFFCVLLKNGSSAKRDEQVEMLWGGGGHTRVSPRNRALDGICCRCI